MCYWACTCPSSAWQTGQKALQKSCVKRHKAVEWMKTSLWERDSSDYHIGSLFAMSTFWYASKVKCGTSYRYLHLKAASSCPRANLVNKWDESCWLHPLALSVLYYGLLLSWRCTTGHTSCRIQFSVVARRQFNWSWCEKIWLDLLLQTFTEISSPRITFMTGTYFEGMLPHVWHCFRCITQIARNRKFLIMV